MVKIYKTGLLKLKFEFIPKNAFSSFCQKYSQAIGEVENQGWVVIPQNVKNPNSLHPFVYRRRSSESARVIARVGLLVRERIEVLGRAGGLPSSPILTGLSQTTPSMNPREARRQVFKVFYGKLYIF
jgi:hypothetical protein